MKRCMQCLVFLFLVVMGTVPQPSAADAPDIVVGRVNDVEGDLLRYVPATKDWVAVVNDSPFGTGDTLFTGNQGMAELTAPNGTTIRFGNSTQVQVMALTPDVAEADVASGVARFYNTGPKTMVKASSPFGYVVAPPGTTFDYYVGENSIELIAVTGTVSFVHAATNAKYDTTAGSPSILADQSQVSSGAGSIEPSWDQWNADREAFWAQQAAASAPSAQYLPPSLHNEGAVLQQNGAWERVPYNGEQRVFWRPTTVPAGWSPFTVGRWTEWSGDQTWIPAEPFGYVTHHYGNWIFVGNAWYWAPPVVGVHVGIPLLDLLFAWSPGRVSWIHSGEHVGWVPLAPQETYYSHHHWGGRHEVVITAAVAGTIAAIAIGRHAYADHAVVINQDRFFNSHSYRDVRVANINHATLVNTYRSSPVITNTVINNYTTNNQRFTSTNVAITEKPHSTAITRIQQNETLIQAGKRDSAAGLQQQTQTIPAGKINPQVKIDQPKTIGTLVPANQVNQPKSGTTLQQKEVKGTNPAKGTAQPGQSTQPGQVASPTQPGQPGRPIQPAQPGQVTQPTRPGQAIPPTQPAQPGQITPTQQTGRPVQPVQPGQATQSGQVTPPSQTGQVAPPTQPSQPGQPAQPTRPGQVTRPVQPVQPGQVAPPTQTGQIAPPTQPSRPIQPVQPGQPTQPGQVVQPTRPGQVTPPTQPVQPAQPGQITPPPQPGRPVQPTQPVQPVQPTQPGQVAQPVQPAQPGQITPTQPGRPTQPVQPTQPTQPGQVAQPPQQPGRPSQPVQPTQPGQVAPPPQTGRPTQPAQPGQPGQGAQPGHMTQPATPNAPVPPVAPAAQPAKPTPPPPAPAKTVPPTAPPAPAPAKAAPPPPAPSPPPPPAKAAPPPAPAKAAPPAPAPAPAPAKAAPPAPAPAPAKAAPAPPTAAPAKATPPAKTPQEEEAEKQKKAK